MISPLSSAVKLSNLGSYIFRTMPSDRLTAKALANHMLKRLKQQKAMVFFNSKSAYSQSLKTEFKDALFYNGVELLGEVDLSRPDFDADESVNQAIGQGAQVLMLAADHSTVDRAIQVVTVNQRRLQVLAGDSFYTPRILTVGGAAAVGTVLAVPADLAQSPFQQRFQQLWGKEQSAGWRSALAFDATQAIAEGIRRNPTRSGIQRAFAHPNFAVAGSEGKVSFQPSGDRQGNVRLVTIAPINTGKRTRYDFKSLP